MHIAITRRVLVGLAAAFIATAVQAQEQPPLLPPILSESQKSAIDQAANNILVRTSTPAASLAVVKEGQVVYVASYGSAQVSPPTPATSEMRYAIGSVSKQFTAVAALMLAEEGKLSLDEPIRRWYPELTAADRITLRHLLSHTSGYADFWPQDYVMPAMSAPVDPDTVIATWAKRPLEFQPGERYEYSNTGFLIAGRIIEKAVGKPLFAVLQERLFTPLNLPTATSFDARNLAYPPDAMGYRRAALAPVRRALRQGAGWGLGAFELAMTAEDLAKWSAALLERRAPLAPASYDQLFTSVKLNNGRDAGYALGLSTSNGARRRVGHGGEVAGFMAQQTIWLNERTAVVALSNLEAAPAASEIATAVGNILFPPASAPTPPPPIRPALPVPPESPESVKVRTLLKGLQLGQPDRALLTPTLSAYFDRDIVGDFGSSLRPLGGIKTVQPIGQFRRGGMTGGAWRVVFEGGAAVNVSTYITREGKFEQFLVSP